MSKDASLNRKCKYGQCKTFDGMLFEMCEKYPNCHEPETELQISNTVDKETGDRIDQARIEINNHMNMPPCNNPNCKLCEARIFNTEHNDEYEKLPLKLKVANHLHIAAELIEESENTDTQKIKWLENIANVLKGIENEWELTN